MKTYAVKTQFIFSGTFYVKAVSELEAGKTVQNNCCLVLGGNIHTSLPYGEADWDFPVHRIKRLQVLSGKEARKNMDKPKIRFIDRHYKTLFFIDDGGEVEIENKSTGLMERFVCRYLDETHVWIGKRIFHICEFAQAMERYSRAYRAPTNN